MTKPDWCPQRVWDEAVRLVDDLDPALLDSQTAIESAAKAILAAEQREQDKMEALLKDPAAVRVNYLRGGIACQPLIDDAVAKEREACAQVAETRSPDDDRLDFQVRQQVATAIRNRSQDQ